MENEPKTDKIATKEVKHQPLVLIILGMAGTGKTTFVESLVKFLVGQGKRTYNVNLDPAVLNVGF